ncbi:hypothetical protein OROMI_004780 [Orobanche minor]
MVEDGDQNKMKDVVKDDIPDIAPFDPTKKKKKKPMPQDLAEEPVDNLVEKTESLSVAHADLMNEENENVEEDLDDTTGEDEEGEGIVLQQHPWEGSDRDYEYEETPNIEDGSGEQVKKPSHGPNWLLVLLLISMI